MTIHLRKIEPTDLPFLYLWENETDVWKDGDTHNPLSQQDLRNYIASTTGDIYQDGQLRLIIESETKDTLGCIDLYNLDIRNRKAGIGIYIAQHARKQGYGTLALQQLQEYAFTFLNLRTLYAFAHVQNTPCNQLFQSAQFQAVATLPYWTLEGNTTLWIKNNPDIL
ncbi:MAG: GNAT family N-acetyltransferase [Paludibacteraceae bacterium]|jgi:diamine N-acetyltransferase|nr:GNAT family N-acetyltransferase [Paludibacteraceae bacterium]